MPASLCRRAALSVSSLAVAALVSACAVTPYTGTPAPMPTVDPAFAEWQAFHLPGKRPTEYNRVMIDGASAVEAKSVASASMLRRQARLEPGELGQLSFDWKIEQLIAAADLTQADASDSPVRLVLAFDGDPARLSMKNRMAFELMQTLVGEAPPFATLMYVWDNKAALETVLPNGRTDRIRKIVVESGPEGVGRWRQHRRDIAADFRRAYGEEPGALIGVALFTDTDNTRSTAHSFYGPVVLRDSSGRVR